MRSTFDESKLTAYALGELPARERAEVEACLAESEALRRELEEIHSTVAALRDALAAEPHVELSPQQRAAIEEQAQKARVVRFPMARILFGPRALAIAASLVVVALGSWTTFQSRRSADLPPVQPRTFGAQPVVPPALPTIAPPASLAGGPGGIEGGVVGGVVGGTIDRSALERLRSLGYVQGGEARHVAPIEVPPEGSIRSPSAEFTTEAYDHIGDNPFILVSQDPRSTFSVDVDTASYSIVRRFLTGGTLPPKDAVRIEELVNYFRYDYASPAGPEPFAVHMETASCPWKPDHRLVRIGIKGRELPRGERPPANLVFLLDVSGSMHAANKLPLVQAAMKLLVNELGRKDRVAIVVYAGAEGLALPSTSIESKAAIVDVLDRLEAGGTTHGSAGLKLAYETAEKHFIKGGVNRVILATDGDFNVGITNQGELIRLIEEKAKSGVLLTALGFGMGNLKDSTLEKLADHGNGNYAYIDTLWEARKVLVDQIGATLVTIAKDVKLQLEFNPSAVKAFRLIGYENRVLAHQDFNDDGKDAGDIGAGHTVTALYEVVPAGGDVEVPGVDPLKYQEPSRPGARAKSDEVLTLKLRHKLPEGDKSALMEVTLRDERRAFEGASTDFRFAAAVASFGMVLRDSPYRGAANLDKTLKWAKASLGDDDGSLRAEFVTLVDRARSFSRSN
jgi:Ca-activated chloride channel family protein